MYSNEDNGYGNAWVPKNHVDLSSYAMYCGLERGWLYRVHVGMHES